MDEVHVVLGHFREGSDKKSGWISGLSEEEGILRPTAGGLRIGKKLDERPLGASQNDRDEWDRDGQVVFFFFSRD